MSGSRYEDQLAPPQISVRATGQGKVAFDLTAGSSGAPDGFTMWWMPESQYYANGQRWYSPGSSLQGEAVFTGAPRVNSWGAVDYALVPGERVTVELGDLLDESGVATNWEDELVPGTRYVFTAFTNGGGHLRPSDPVTASPEQTLGIGVCAYTRGNWRDHPEHWPVSSLFLGSTFYTAPQLLSILQQGSTPNGLVVLARQLIAAKLNVANGADDTTVRTAIQAADALIGFLAVPPVGTDWLSPFQVRDLTQTLDDYNNGVGIPDPCVPTALEEASWGSLKAAYR